MNSDSPKAARTPGLTLTELLILLGVTVLLAAILFPILSRSRELVRRTSCQSNLKQIGIAVFQYTQDNDKRWPILNQSHGVPGFYIEIQPYLKSLQVLQCPSEPTPPPNPSTDTTSNVYVDYAHNLSLGWSAKNRLPASHKVSILAQPALTVLAVDHAPSWGDNWTCGCGTSHAAECTNGPGFAKFVGGAQRHLTSQNVLFCDGHVKDYRGATSTQSAVIYNYAAPRSISHNNPTFNLTP